MVRPRKCRIISNHPIAEIYKPVGVPACQLKMATLSIDGLESLRLADVEGLEHSEAAKSMEISRPTFSRLLAEAHKIVSTALINGWALSIQGGKFIHKEKTDMQKIAVSCMGNNLEAKIDPRFGRANEFLIINSDTMEFDHIDNSKVNEMGSGAGIQTAEMIAKSGANVVLTGSVGPKAAAALSAAGIKFVEGLEGLSVIDAIKKFKADNE